MKTSKKIKEGELDLVEVIETQEPSIRRYHEEEIDARIEQKTSEIADIQAELDELNEYKLLFK